MALSTLKLIKLTTKCFATTKTTKYIPKKKIILEKNASTDTDNCSETHTGRKPVIA